MPASISAVQGGGASRDQAEKGWDPWARMGSHPSTLPITMAACKSHILPSPHTSLIPRFHLGGEAGIDLTD